MLRIIITILLLLSFRLNAQNTTEYFPNDLTIKPFVANNLEPKLGFLFKTSSEGGLRLDIGNSIDLIRVKRENKEVISFGADLFTFTKLRSEDNFKFPVEAVDYLFGVNFGYKKSLRNGTEYGARFRISHISAHLADGRFDGKSDNWIDNYKPFVYSREFFELMSYYKINDFRFYAGITYIFNLIPTDISSDNFQLGIEYFGDPILGDLVTPFFAYDFKIVHVGPYTANNTVNAGIKFGKKNGKGFSVYINYFSGKSLHGLFYKNNNEYSALGFNIDL